MDNCEISPLSAMSDMAKAARHLYYDLQDSSSGKVIQGDVAMQLPVALQALSMKEREQAEWHRDEVLLDYTSCLG